ncbi:MAG: hypothetical protein WD341_01980 [Tistlia sp.]|uniref:hypothetical protein n=1 Tax=Tistlia sp. TaxID=3057121 RepID=UPI0034A4E126
MLRAALLAPLALVLSTGLCAAGPIPPTFDYSWRFSGVVTEVAEAPAPDVYYAPFLGVGDRIEGRVSVNLPAGTDTSGPIMLPVEEIHAQGGLFEASFTARADFDPSRPRAGLMDFQFSGAYDGYVSFLGSTGTLLDVGGYAEQGYAGGPFAQFRWGPTGNQIQQLANDQGQSVPSHFFTYEWEAELVRPWQIPEPSAGLLYASGLALLAASLGVRRRRAGH